MRFAVVTAVALASLVIGTETAKAHAPWKHQTKLTAPKLHYLKFLRAEIIDERADRCLPRHNFKHRSVYQIAVHNRTIVIKTYRRILAKIEDMASRCLPFPMWWYRQAMCIHRYEGAWNEPSGLGPRVSGGMQIGDYEWRISGGLRYAPRAYLASPLEQLIVAWKYYRLTGYDWGAWPNTARKCGLL